MGLTANQMAMRRGKITASVVPLILGISPYGGHRTAYDQIWQLDGFAGNDATLAGECLEDGIARLWQAKHEGMPDVPTKMIQGETFPHPYHPEYVATPDRLLFTGRKGEGVAALLEIKCLSVETFALWGDVPPPTVECQVRWQMFVCAMPRCFVAGYADTKRFRFYEVRRDAETEAAIVTIARAFYENHVKPRIRPDSDDRAEPSSPIITPHKGRVRTVETGSGADLLGREAVELADQKQAHQAEIKLIDERLDAIKAELVPELGDAEVLQGDGWALKASYCKGRVDWQSVAKSLYRPEDEGRFAELVKTNTAPTTERLYLKPR